MTEGDSVGIADLPPKFRDAIRIHASGRQKSDGTAGSDFYQRVSEFEKALLADEYAKWDGNVSKMALNLGMDRSHLHSRLKEYGIHSARLGKTP